MKRKIFTILMMLALVIVAGKAFAQPTKYAPVVGTEFDYIVSGLSDDDTYEFSVNTSTTTPGGNDGCTITGATGTVGGGGNNATEASTTIEWTTAGTYNLWIVVTDDAASGCSNQRYTEITVAANDFDVTITSLGASTEDVLTDWSTASSVVEDCPEFSTGADFDIDNGNSDGSSYLFFRVALADHNGGTWDFSVASDLGGTVQYYATGSWSGSAPTGLDNTATPQLVRITLSNVPAGQTETATVTATENYSGGTLPDGDDPDAEVSIELYPMPDVGSATFE